MVEKKFLAQIRTDFTNFSGEYKILGILLFGSEVTDNQTNRSDVDICIIAPDEDSIKLFSYLSANIDIYSKRYDIKFFKELPLYIQIRIIENHILIYAKDELDLYEYFYPYRKLWADQKHRQELTKEELLSLLD